MSLTKREALIITAWTAHLMVPFGEFHKFAEDILNKLIWTHEFASELIWDELKEKVEDEFMKILNEVAE